MTFHFTPSDDVRHAITDSVLTVTVDRPEKRNPLSLGVLESIRRIFTELAGDERVHVAVLTGAGDKAFASGGDLGELAGYRSREDAEAFSRHGKAALDAIRLFPVPVIARLNGLALGGGAELALACDQRYAARHVKIGFIHGRLAISPSWGGGNDLVRLVGPAKALRLMATAATLDATDAQTMGIVDLTCADETGFDEWFAEQITPFARHPRQVTRAYKAIANGSRGPGRGEMDVIETHHFGEVWAHEDHWCAVAALERKSK
jgi:enoyl-CoA hydratase